MHTFENNLLALFTLCPQHPLPCGSVSRTHFIHYHLVLLSVHFFALILLLKCPLFKSWTSLSILFILHHLSFSELLYFITLYSEFQASINSTDIRAGTLLSLFGISNSFPESEISFPPQKSTVENSMLNMT